MKQSPFTTLIAQTQTGPVKMDPLSITASVIAVIGLADRIISFCQGYIAKMKDAPSDLRAIMVKVNSLKSVVTSPSIFCLHGLQAICYIWSRVLGGSRDLLRHPEKHLWLWKSSSHQQWMPTLQGRSAEQRLSPMPNLRGHLGRKRFLKSSRILIVSRL